MSDNIGAAMDEAGVSFDRDTLVWLRSDAGREVVARELGLDDVDATVYDLTKRDDVVALAVERAYFEGFRTGWVASNGE